jgi:hypothetical protein
MHALILSMLLFFIRRGNRRANKIMAFSLLARAIGLGRSDRFLRTSIPGTLTLILIRIAAKAFDQEDSTTLNRPAC